MFAHTFLDKVLRDDQIAGGSRLREADKWMSRKLGGYLSIKEGKRTEPSFYGKYIEPPLHAVEHLRRGVANNNQAEYGRAKDALGATGIGLHEKDRKYQESYRNQG